MTEEQEEALFQEFVKKAEGEPEPAKEPATLEPTPAVEPAPAPVPGDTETAKKADTEPAKPAAAVEPSFDDLLKDVPEGARAGLKARLEADAAEKARLSQDNRSMAGRVSAYQRRYEEATGKRAPTPEPAATPEQKQEWKTFAGQYPEIAQAIEARFAAEQESAAKPEMADIVQFVQDQKRQQFLKDAWEAVDAVHPNWRTEGRTKEFVEWKKSSSTYEKLAASDDIADAVALFDLYGAHKARLPKADQPAPQPTAAADKVAARREAQAAGAASPSGKPAQPNQSVDLDDPDQLFAFYAAKSNERIKRRSL
jgi:hypothetical protein